MWRNKEFSKQRTLIETRQMKGFTRINLQHYSTKNTAMKRERDTKPCKAKGL